MSAGEITRAPVKASRATTTQARPTLELAQVAKDFGAVSAVTDLSLSVVRGEFFTLLGPSGSGKTTVLRLVAGFDQPTAGEIRLDGENVSKRPPGERNIGFVFQGYALFPHMTVSQNIAYPLKLRRWPKHAMTDRVDEMLELVRLPGYGERLPRELSGGQQQRVAVARALSFHPKLLLMDEPLGALDRALRLEVQEQIRAIHRASGTTMVHVTHDQEEALAMSDRIGIMRDGRLLQVGTPRMLYEEPAAGFVSRFLGDCFLIEARLVSRDDERTAQVEVLGRTVRVPCAPDPLTDHCALAVWPSRIRLRPEPGDLIFSGEVLDVVYAGDGAKISCRAVPMKVEFSFRTDTASAAEISQGQAVELGFAPGQTRFVPTDTKQPRP